MRRFLPAAVLAAVLIHGPAALAEPRVVAGRTVDTRGAPLAGVAIWADVQAVWSKPGRGVSAPDGAYRVEKLVPQYVYKVFAWHKLNYRGQTYCLRLAPDGDAGEFAGKDGALRSFRWQLTGRMADAAGAPGEPATSWGGDVRVFTEFEDGDHDGTLDLLLDPVGPLIDGTQGQRVTRSLDLSKTAFATDIPVGVYKVTATYRARDGRKLAVRFGPDAAGAKPEGTLEWKPYASPECGSAATANGVERAFLWAFRP